MSSPKRLLLALTVFCFLASACEIPVGGTPVKTALPVTSVAVSTASQTLMPIPTLTTTQPPTELISTPTIPPTETITPLPTISTFTPTFDARTIVTATPAPKAECSKIDTSLKPDFQLPPSPGSCQTQDCFPTNTANKILDFLNKGGTVASVIQRLKTANVRENTGYIYKDVTGDTVPEFMFQDWGLYSRFHVLACENMKYALFSPEIDDPYSTSIVTVQDLNSDGIPEIVLSTLGLYIFEWNGSAFENISPDLPSWSTDYKIQDIDRNGIKEIIVSGDHPVTGTYSLYLPWRPSKGTFTWDGNIFTLASIEFAPPQYRFQAIQDADRYTLNKDYDKALSLYQESIFNNKLEWWSVARRQYLNSTYNENPELFPTPAVDATEYPRLAAYAYYRMVILHTHLGQMDAAATQYASLQQKFSAAGPGQPYAEMASAFWDAYQSSRNMTNACGAAITYAAAHSDMLTVLGSNYHGSQSHIYVPADVCPFR
jgi:hypothetical protein